MIDLVQNILNGLKKKSSKRDAKISMQDFPSLDILDEGQIRNLESILNIKITHREFFEQALTHRSYIQVLNDVTVTSNERLEFLGDAVLNLVIADHLFITNSQVAEGELTKMRSWLVNKNSLSLYARNIELEKFVKLSYSAAKAVESGSDNILADALEAIIGAIYLDSGYKSASDFIINILLPVIVNHNMMVDKNYKSLLLEEVQAQGYDAPKYNVLEEIGPDHNKEFVVGVFVNNEMVGIGQGKSKKQAEQYAAENAIKKNKQNSDK